jgi:hypothetical protein
VSTYRRLAIGLLAVTLIVSALLGFGISSTDERRTRDFVSAVESWQHDPDFRVVERAYVTRGVEAMQARGLGVSAERMIMGFRKLPGIPSYLAASESSVAHYRAFTAGEMSAYLRLTGEQDVSMGLRLVEDLARRQPISDADVVGFLNGFKLPFPITTDAGAVASVRRLLSDTDAAARTFVIRGDLVPQLRRHVAGNIEAMTPAEQADVFRQLDDRIRAADPELWRTKQVADFLGGIWAQGYGPIYVSAITWVFRVRMIARIVFVASLIVCATLFVTRRRRATAAVGRSTAV